PAPPLFPYTTLFRSDARDHLEIARDHPVLDAPQLRGTQTLRGDAIPIDFADGRRHWRQLRLHAAREIDALQPLEHLLAREVIVRDRKSTRLNSSHVS